MVVSLVHMLWLTNADCFWGVICWCSHLVAIVVAVIAVGAVVAVVAVLVAALVLLLLLLLLLVPVLVLAVVMKARLRRKPCWSLCLSERSELGRVPSHFLDLAGPGRSKTSQIAIRISSDGKPHFGSKIILLLTLAAFESGRRHEMQTRASFLNTSAANTV